MTVDRVETDRDRAWTALADMHGGKFSVDVFEKHIHAAVEAEREDAIAFVERCQILDIEPARSSAFGASAMKQIILGTLRARKEGEG